MWSQHFIFLTIILTTAYFSLVITEDFNKLKLNGAASENLFPIESDINNDKRLRNFVGKRNNVEGDSSETLEILNTKRLRNFVGKRDPIDSDFISSDKRLRNFLGKRSYFSTNNAAVQKRLRNFLGKRLYNFVGKRDIDAEQNEEKRLRNFLGKRNFQDGDKEKRLRNFLGKRVVLDVEKRLRNFLGKRADDLFPEEKRLRNFLGKRHSLDTSEYPLTLMVKRLRNFLGKRDGNVNTEKLLLNFLGEHMSPYYLDFIDQVDLKSLIKDLDSDDPASEQLYNLAEKRSDSRAKRLRNFLGKREDNDSFEKEKRLRNFLGKRDRNPHDEKPKRLRNFLGKRNSEDDKEDVKRLRNFVGKRNGDEETNDHGVGKFDGKSSTDTADTQESLPRLKRSLGNFEEPYNPEKRLRNFVGKRYDDAYLNDISEEKRLRNFVGKREFSYFPYPQKRLRNFVGKRSDIVASFDGESSWYPQQKRLRNFVGKRSDLQYGHPSMHPLDDRLGSGFDQRIGPLFHSDTAQEQFGMDKRLRNFVGKRSPVMLSPYTALHHPHKRFADVIRNRVVRAVSSPFVPVIHKRLREFIGK